MLRPTHHFGILVVLCLLLSVPHPVQADDVDVVKEKIFQSKKDYDGEMQKFKKSVENLLDKREETARAAGDKKAVDQIKAEREAFAKLGEIPPVLPAPIRQQAITAKNNLEKVYAAAVKDFLKLKKDAEADNADKERQELVANFATLFGKKKFLSTLKAFDVKTDSNSFNGDETITINGEVTPHCVFLHPPKMGSSQASYPLAGKCSAFRATLGVPKSAGTPDELVTALTFEVHGDGKLLWKSDPFTKRNTFQTCTVNVEKVKTLTLRVDCPGNNAWSYAYWCAPILVE